MSDAVVLDATAPLFQSARRISGRLPAFREGGLDAVLATVASIEDLAGVAQSLAEWQVFARDAAAPARVVTTAEAIRQAKMDGIPAIGLHVQGLDALGSNADLLDLYHRMGVRVAQPTYNYRNSLGDGCLEPGNAGLSEAGRQVVRRANELGVLLDIAHVGERTSLEMLGLSTRPVVASHSNARAVCDSPRNLTDEQIRIVAESGGVIGLCAFPAFVAREGPTVEKLADHAVHIANLVGAEHLGLGLDFAVEDEDDYEYFRYDERYYPRPPWVWPTGIEDQSQVPNVATALAQRGFSTSDVAGVMGENFMRVFADVWRD